MRAWLESYRHNQLSPGKHVLHKYAIIALRKACPKETGMEAIACGGTHLAKNQLSPTTSMRSWKNSNNNAQ